MGMTTRNLSYNQGTNTLSGTAVHDQEVHVHINGARATFAKGMSSKATGAFSIVLTGLTAGPYTVQCSCNGSTLGPKLAITKT